MNKVIGYKLNFSMFYNFIKVSIYFYQLLKLHKTNITSETLLCYMYTFQANLLALTHCWTMGSWVGRFNPLRMKTTFYLFLRGNKSLLYHQIGNRNFFISITIQWNLMFCANKIKYEHLAMLSNLKSCQFAPRIVIFNLCICCQFEDSQIISP